MIWSKTKKSIEGLLAEKLIGHVRFYKTRYGPGESQIQTRAWITLDKKEIFSCSTIGWIKENYSSTGNSGWNANEQTEKDLNAKGNFSVQSFVAALDEYLRMPIDQAIQSSNVIIRAIAMFDRRLGKNHLWKLHPSEDDHPLVLSFYAIRCQVEGINPNQ